jgi:hypothetical protein
MTEILTGKGKMSELPHGVDVVQTQVVYLLAVPHVQLAQGRHRGQVANAHVTHQITPEKKHNGGRK